MNLRAAVITPSFGRMEISFQSMVEQISAHAIVVLDSAGIVRSWNAGARRITGYTEREAVGRPLSEFLREDLVAQAMKAGHASMQGWLVRKGGKTLWTANVVQAVAAGRDGPSLCWVCQDPFDT
jgi:PAS domain S-box-containing protein